MMESADKNLIDYWNIILKRKWIIAIVSAIVMLGTAFFTKLQVPVYQTGVEVRIEKRNASMRPGGNLIYGIDMSDYPNLTSEIRTLKSLPIIKEAIEKVEPLPDDPEAREKEKLRLAFKYQSSVSASQIDDSNIISLRVTSDDPHKAALLANAIVSVYSQENVKLRRKKIQGALDYTVEQINKQQKSIKQLEKELSKFQQNERVFVVTPDVKSVLDRLTLESTLELEGKIIGIQQDITMLDRIVKQYEKERPSNVLTEKHLSNNFVFSSIRRQLLELEFRKFLLLIDYTANHPEVISIDKEIKSAKVKMVGLIKKAYGKDFTAQMDGDLALILKKLFLKNRQEVIYRIVMRFYDDSGSLSPDQSRYQDLNRDIKNLLASYETLLTKKQELELASAEVVNDEITLITEATIPSVPIKPNFQLNMRIGAIMALLLSFFVAFTLEGMDTSIETIEDVNVHIAKPLLASLNYISINATTVQEQDFKDRIDRDSFIQRQRLVSVYDPNSEVAEQIKILRSHLIQQVKLEDKNVFLITSAVGQEGKITVGLNLAFSLSQLGKKVLLIEANSHRPNVHNVLGVPKSPGLADVLMKRIEWKEAMKGPSDIILGDLELDHLLNMCGIDNMRVMTSGTKVVNATEVLTSIEIESLLNEARKEFDFVLLLSPAILPVSDVATLASYVDGTVLVCSSGKTTRSEIKQAINYLESISPNVLGIVLNNTKASVSKKDWSFLKFSRS